MRSRRREAVFSAKPSEAGIRRGQTRFPIAASEICAVEKSSRTHGAAGACDEPLSVLSIH